MKLITRLCLLFLVSCGLIAPTLAQTSLEERGYGTIIPPVAQTRPVPLLIVLHGFGDDYQNFAPATGLIDLALEQGFVVAFPNGYLHQWNDGSLGDHYEDDIAILQELIEVVASQAQIDRERIYLAGFSNGATMVYRVACETEGIFAGYAAIGGTMRRRQECPSTVRASMLVLHGVADAVVPFDGGEDRYSVPDTVQRWVRQNHCETANVPAFDRNRFVRGLAIYYYDNCEEGEQVMLYAMRDVGHQWPSSQYYVAGARNIPQGYDTARIIWGFFDLSYASQQANRPESTETAPAGD